MSFMFKSFRYFWRSCSFIIKGCLYALLIIRAAEEYCGMLTKADGAFAECHSLIDTTSFAEKCAIDLCANNGDPNILKEVS